MFFLRLEQLLSYPGRATHYFGKSRTLFIITLTLLNIEHYNNNIFSPKNISGIYVYMFLQAS